MADRKRRKSLFNKSRNIEISPPKSSKDSQNCIICFDKVSCRGKLSVCDHWFCFPCIFEWSKNTNTCPVCKAKFRCISKTHLVPGKSPVQKIRVPDIDQRAHQDDEDFIWAAIESLSENEVSDYEPSSNDDIHDESFEISFNMIMDTDDSSTDMEEMSEASSWDSDTSESISCDSEEMSSTNYMIDKDWSPSPCVIKKKKSSRCNRVVTSDGETSEASVDDNDAKRQDKWQPRDRNRKSKGKGTARGGFRRHNRLKPRRLSSERFEAELKRLRSKKKDQKRKTTSKMNTSNKQGNRTTREKTRESASNTGRWLNVASASPQPSTSARSSNTQNLTRQRRTGTTATTSSRHRFRDEDNSAGGAELCFLTQDLGNTRRRQTPSFNERSIQVNRRRNVKTSVKVQVSYESKRNESESRQVQSILPKTRSHKRRTRKFELESESESSSGESWTALVQPSKKANVSERVRHTTTNKRSSTKKPSRVLQELQNFFDDTDS